MDDFFQGDGSLPAGYGSPVGTGVEAGGRPVATDGNVAPPYMSQRGPAGAPLTGQRIPDRGPQGAWGPQPGTWGAGAVPASAQVAGAGGYVYQRYSDGSIKIVSGPSGAGTFIQPTSKYYTAIDAELASRGVPASSGTATSGSAVTGGGGINLQALFQAGQQLTTAAAQQRAQQGTRRPRQQPQFDPSAQAQLPAPAPSGTPWGLIIGGVIVTGLVVGGVYYATRRG